MKFDNFYPFCSLNMYEPLKGFTERMGICVYMYVCMCSQRGQTEGIGAVNKGKGKESFNVTTKAW